MKKLLTLLLFIIPALAFAQSPVVISQPYLFQKYITTFDSIVKVNNLQDSLASRRYARNYIKWYVAGHQPNLTPYLQKADSADYITPYYLNQNFIPINGNIYRDANINIGTHFLDIGDGSASYLHINGTSAFNNGAFTLQAGDYSTAVSQISGSGNNLHLQYQGEILGKLKQIRFDSLYMKVTDQTGQGLIDADDYSAYQITDDNSLTSTKAVKLLIGSVGGAAYIQNQSAVVQDGDFNISGAGVSSSFQARLNPSFPLYTGILNPNGVKILNSGTEDFANMELIDTAVRFQANKDFYFVTSRARGALAPNKPDGFVRVQDLPGGAIGGTLVTSFNGRTGPVSPLYSDYPNYFYKPGISGGQQWVSGTGSTDIARFQSTSGYTPLNSASTQGSFLFSNTYTNNSSYLAIVDTLSTPGTTALNFFTTLPRVSLTGASNQQIRNQFNMLTVSLNGGSMINTTGAGNNYNRVIIRNSGDVIVANSVFARGVESYNLARVHVGNAFAAEGGATTDNGGISFGTFDYTHQYSASKSTLGGTGNAAFYLGNSGSSMSSPTYTGNYALVSENTLQSAFTGALYTGSLSGTRQLESTSTAAQLRLNNTSSIYGEQFVDASGNYKNYLNGTFRSWRYAPLASAKTVLSTSTMEIEGGDGSHTNTLTLRNPVDTSNVSLTLPLWKIGFYSDDVSGGVGNRAELAVLPRSNDLTQASFQFNLKDATSLKEAWRMTPTSFSNTGANGTAYIHFKAGTTAASTAPIKFTLTSAALMTTPENGALEPDASGNLYLTNNGGTRNQFAFVNSPSFTTPALGVATATSINKVTITAPATSATLTLVQGSSLITAGAFATTLTATGTTNVTLPNTGTLSAIAGTETLTNKTLTTPKLTGYTVATLPAGTVGMIAYVTDALTPAALTLVVGGGAQVVPVFYNGTQWIVQ